MVEQKIIELLNKEFEEKYQDMIEENYRLQTQLNKAIEENVVLRSNQLKSEKERKKVEQFNSLRKLFDYNSLETMIEGQDYKEVKIDLSGMHSEDTPKIFKLICKYYYNRQEILDIMDTFEQPYPNWYRTFKLPFDYSKEELMSIMDKNHKISMTNSCYFEGYIGFYYEWMKNYNGDINSQLGVETAYSNSLRIPFDLLLVNPLWKDDELFNALLKEVNKDFGKHEFYHIVKYQDLSKDQVFQLARTLKNKTHQSYKSVVIGSHPEVLSDEQVLSVFEDKISDSRYSPFHFTKYPQEQQINFILNSVNNKEIWNRSSWELLEQSTISISKKNEVALKLIKMNQQIDLLL